MDDDLEKDKFEGVDPSSQIHKSCTIKVDLYMKEFLIGFSSTLQIQLNS